MTVIIYAKKQNNMDFDRTLNVKSSFENKFKKIFQKGIAKFCGDTIIRRTQRRAVVKI